MAFDVKRSRCGNYPLITCMGRAVGTDVKKLQRKLDNAAQKEPRRIYVDISKVQFMDSHGLGVLVFFHTILNRSKRQLVLIYSNPNPQTYINRLFDMTQLRRVLRIIDKTPV